MLGITKIAFALVALTASSGKKHDAKHDMHAELLFWQGSSSEEVRSNMPRALSAPLRLVCVCVHLLRRLSFLTLPSACCSSACFLALPVETVTRRYTCFSLFPFVVHFFPAFVCTPPSSISAFLLHMPDQPFELLLQYIHRTPTRAAFSFRGTRAFCPLPTSSPLLFLSQSLPVCSCVCRLLCVCLFVCVSRASVTTL